MNVYLISEDKIKSETVICDNTDPMYIIPAIESAQEVGLQQLIGTKLLDKLCNIVENGEIKSPVNSNYKILLDKFITPYLKYKVCSEITMMVAYKYRNAGLVLTNKEFVNNTSMEDAQTMKEFYDQKASFFAIRIGQFINSHRDLYPEYCNNDCGDVKSSPNGYNTGIFLD